MSGLNRGDARERRVADTIPMPAQPQAEPPTLRYVRPNAWARLKARISALARSVVERSQQRKQQAPRRKLPWKRRLRRWAWRLAAVASTLVGLGLFSFAGLIWYYGTDLPETSELKHYNPPQVTRILARDGTLLAELFVERRTLVTIADVPSVMKFAVLAAEDAAFYDHEGLNYFGILRALLVNLRSGRAQQGGSTITQQVVKNVLLTPERTFERKIRELILARRIEQELSKDQILELYLNRIYLGHGRYGVEEATRYYFGKSVREVTLVEAALLAGLVKGPSIYSPRVDRTRALERRSFVLGQMRDKGFASPADVQVAMGQDIALSAPPESAAELAPEAIAAVERELEATLGPHAKHGGYTVTTTIDPALQAAARAAVRANLDAYVTRHATVSARTRRTPAPSPASPRPRPESALVALDVQTAEVLAMVGGYDGVRGALDRATAAHRQPASAFKPIVYSYAIHTRAFTAATILETNPAALGGKYRPGNFDESEGRAPRRLREALAHSVNVAAVWTLNRVKPANVVEWAKQLGISSKLGPDLSLALGAYEVTPMELAAAYTTFAARGIYNEPRFIRRIEAPGGRELPLPRSATQRRVMDEAEAYIVTSLLRSVVESGTAKKARSLPFPIAGKTGTSNASKDAWFAGYSPEIACVVWTGFDDASPLGPKETGSVTSLPVFIAFMQQAHKGKPRSDFAVPANGVVRVMIDPESGQLASGGDGAIEEVFLAGTEPTELAEPQLSGELPRIWPF
jgi:penicillin-binding protein 1A